MLTRQSRLLALACAYLICMWRLPVADMAIHSRSGTAANSVYSEKNKAQDKGTPTYTAAPSTIQNTDLTDKLTWKCANNASCLYAVANGILASYKRGETIKLGLFDLVKLPPLPAEAGRKVKQKWTGRGISTFMDFIGGNAIRFPVGPMVFSVQRADDDSDYIEVALLKKATASQGRLQGGNGGSGLLSSGSGNGGGLLGGNGGNGGNGGLMGGEGLLGGRRRHKQEQQDKKQFQMYIPMYLAATTFGWTMVAAKAVGLLTLKALLISKIAFVVAAIVLIKKLMDNASEKMMYQFPEHTPYMMPYNMDYPVHGAEIGTDMYPAALHLAAAGGGSSGSGLPHSGHPGFEGLAAESHLHQNVADVHNNTQVLAALNAVGLGHKVKPTSPRRPLVYNYMQPHMPYYRS